MFNYLNVNKMKKYTSSIFSMIILSLFVIGKTDACEIITKKEGCCIKVTLECPNFGYADLDFGDGSPQVKLDDPNKGIVHCYDLPGFYTIRARCFDPVGAPLGTDITKEDMKSCDDCNEFLCVDRHGNERYVDDCSLCDNYPTENKDECECEAGCSLYGGVTNISCHEDDQGNLKSARLLRAAGCTGENDGEFLFAWYKDGDIIETTTGTGLDLDNNDYIPIGMPDGPKAATPRYGAGNGEYWFVVTNEGCCPGLSVESNHVYVGCW